MTNPQIAAVFDRIGRLLELTGANPFRVRAYSRAAQFIESLPRSLSEIHREGGEDGLRELPGIGADLAAKIAEMVTTGKLGYLQELEEQVPAGLLQIMEVEGMGPKKTRQLWETFNVTTLAGLKKLADSGKLEDLKGWGEKSVEKLKKGMLQREQVTGRMPLGQAFPLAQELVTVLRESGLCERIEIAGSLRRRRETIGDIDILVTSKDPEAVMDLWSRMPQVQDVIGRGPTKCSIRLDVGVQADLRVLDDDVFGAALHYFTGSKEHNVLVRSLAQKKGITINEYGAFKGTAEKKGKLVACRTEEDVFAAVGMDYVPPEMREGRGEVELALGHKLPRLLEVADLKGDVHTHSDVSDGVATIAEMAAAARDRGLQYLAITDHASSMGMVRGIKDDSVGDFRKKVEAAQKQVSGIHLLAGAEVDILEDGSLYLSDDALAQLDWVVASVHQHFGQTAETFTKRLVAAAKHPSVAVLGHPTTRILGRRTALEADWDTVFKAAAAAGTAVELNASPERLDLPDVLLARARELGVKVAVGTDAHGPDGLDPTLGISQARRAWITPGDVLNALPWAAFQKVLRRRS